MTELQQRAYEQYRHFKARFPRCVLLFRVGDFYEAYSDDARVVARVVGVGLSEREHPEGGPPVITAALSYKTVNEDLKMLLKAGHRVSLCEQVQEGQAKPPRQEVIRIRDDQPIVSSQEATAEGGARP
jgi:DNA mismatch repair protein MutS